jgi:hypothetical protein
VAVVRSPGNAPLPRGCGVRRSGYEAKFMHGRYRANKHGTTSARRLRATLADNVAFERACQEGRALTLEQAIELA